MKRNSLFTKAIALLVCAIMLIGYLPSIALPVAANDFESDIDVVETTEAPTEAPGAESNPIALIFEDNGEGSLVANTEEIPAGATVYYSIKNITGDVVFEGAESYSISYNGTTYDAVEWTATLPIVSDSYNHAVIGITNNDAEYAASLTAKYTFPEGTIDNPQDLWEGDNSVTLEAGSQGWYFDYVGYSDGYLTVTVSGDNWQYVINNETTYQYGDNHTSADEPQVASETLEYHAGDKVVVFVNTFNAEDVWNTPAGSVNVNISFVPGFGTEESPYQLTELENTITVPAGETVWYQGWFNGLEMTVIGENYAVIYNGETVDEVDHMTVTAANPRMPVTFAVTNNGEADAEYQVNFSYAPGTVENPAVAVLGDNVAEFEEGAAEYVWQYEAEKDGELNITISSDSDNWQYTVNNMTSYVYGDTQWSDSDPVVNPTVLEVAAGDLIQIKVITYDPANPWSAPNGTITTNLAYACEHANTTTTNTATCTEAGVETVVCNDCGVTISETEVPALGHDYTGENGACVNCGEYQIDSNLKFYQVGLSFAEYIGVQPMLLKNVVKNYSSFYVEAVHTSESGEAVTVLEPVLSTSSYNVYDMAMLARSMTDGIKLTIYAVKDGVTYQSTPVVTSITDLALDKIASYQADGELGVCKVLVDMLTYGSEVQKAFGYKVTDVPTNYLGDYAALGSTTTPEISGEVSIEGSGIRVYANSFSMGSMVEIQFMFKTSAVAGCELRYTLNGETVAIDASEFDTTVMSGYSVACIALKPRNFRDTMTMAVYNIASGEVVSAVYTASVEDYAAGVLSKYPTLVPAIMNYCDSVVAEYVN